ncbi:MAG: hypothetical protein DRR19_15870 [Candidatus Parabeggiatoa sp. nov. 1]|nr:MAG: hypothetical protein DRR19_15870 [Gammaproteobacteria bacterium]
MPFQAKLTKYCCSWKPIKIFQFKKMIWQQEVFVQALVSLFCMINKILNIVINMSPIPAKILSPQCLFKRGSDFCHQNGSLKNPMSSMQSDFLTFNIILTKKTFLLTGFFL